MIKENERPKMFDWQPVDRMPQYTDDPIFEDYNIVRRQQEYGQKHYKINRVN